MNDELNQAVRAAKDPATYSFATYAWVILMSAWGGMVRVLQELRDNPGEFRRALLKLAVEVFTSIFVGIVTFFACEYAEFKPLLTAVCIAITSHMGTKAFGLIRNLITRNLINGTPGS